MAMTACCGIVREKVACHRHGKQWCRDTAAAAAHGELMRGTTCAGQLYGVAMATADAAAAVVLAAHKWGNFRGTGYGCYERRRRRHD